MEGNDILVEGVLLLVEGIVDGEWFEYEVFFDENGRFLIDVIYIGEGIVDYMVSVKYWDYKFLDFE